MDKKIQDINRYAKKNKTCAIINSEFISPEIKKFISQDNISTKDILEQYGVDLIKFIDNYRRIIEVCQPDIHIQIVIIEAIHIITVSMVNLGYADSESERLDMLKASISKSERVNIKFAVNSLYLEVTH